MQRADIVAGLKNAIERGYSLELAIQSFISAGYNRQDVLDSAASIGGVMMQHPQLQAPQTTPQLSQPAQSQPQPQLSQPAQSQTTQPKPLPQSSTREIKQNIQQPIMQPQPSSQSIPPVQEIQIPQAKKSKKGILIVIILIVVLVILLSVLGITIFARDWISSLFGLGQS
ncbi:hypothetical protein FJZ19_03855 [Candidatus Pacearchaeota archaeon]|nr:hypothetical protein [Candidatus Pacearchaeota archaeon]